MFRRRRHAWAQVCLSTVLPRLFGQLFKHTPEPVTSAINPGCAVELRLDAKTGQVGHVHAVACLAGVLRRRGIEVKERAAWLELKRGLVLQPRIVSAQRQPAGHWLTTTTIEVTHPDLFPQGVFEYQHAAGHDVAQTFAQGFEHFAVIDLPVFVDLASDQLRECSSVSFERSDGPLGMPQPRRVLLGPVSRQITAPVAADEAHPFCPCCFFTHTLETMKEKLREPDLLAVRLYAARYPDKGLVADCRVNGLDWEAGKQAMLAYAATWPDQGFETRRQHLVMHTLR